MVLNHMICKVAWHVCCKHLFTRAATEAPDGVGPILPNSTYGIYILVESVGGVPCHINLTQVLVLPLFFFSATSNLVPDLEPLAL